MSLFKENYCLKSLNTFKIKIQTKYFAEFYSIDELICILNSNIYKNNDSFILGGGSNILFTKNYTGVVIHNRIQGIQIMEQDSNFVYVKVGAGENWHDFVEWSVSKSLSGIENLALIPGTVGASPVQNIGAYGMEVKDCIKEVNTINIDKRKEETYLNKNCQFKYRNSIFKTTLKNKIIITSVIFKLSKKPLNKTKYGEIQHELTLRKLDPSPKNIMETVIKIRTKKLPDPNKIGNCGSFFKNPIISSAHFKNLKKDFPKIVSYQVSKYKFKIAAGWLIENAGLKGFKIGNAGTHQKQALVIVNYGNATGLEIKGLAEKIQLKVFQKYKIKLETEVNII